MSVVVPDVEAANGMGVAEGLAQEGISYVTGSSHTGSAEELERLLTPEVSIIVVSLCPVPERILGHPSLRLVVRTGMGIENIDTEAAYRAGVTVVRTVGVNVSGVAEYTLGAMVSLSRGFMQCDAIVRRGAWSAERSKYSGTCRELAGSTLGIVGLGGVGRHLAMLASALGVEVVATDPPREAELVAEGYRMMRLEALLEMSRFVSINAELNASTRHLIDRSALELMSRDAFLINTARGAIVDTRALADALARGSIAGAMIDVLEEEPPPDDHPLLSAPNAVLSPHVAGTTRDGLRRIGARAVEHVKTFRSGGTLPLSDIVVSGENDGLPVTG